MVKQNTTWQQKLLKLSNNKNFLQLATFSLAILLLGSLVLMTALYQDYNQLKDGSTGNPYGDKLTEFYDEDLDIKFMYPKAWEVDTRINLDSSYEDPGIPVGNIPDLAELEIILSSDAGTTIRFVHFFGDLSAKYKQFDPTGRLYEVIDNKLLRYQAADAPKWYYVDIVDCEQVETANVNSEIEPRICVGDYYSGFISGPSRVVVSGRTDLDTLKLVDQVVLSALSE